MRFLYSHLGIFLICRVEFPLSLCALRHSFRPSEFASLLRECSRFISNFLLDIVLRSLNKAFARHFLF